MFVRKSERKSPEIPTAALPDIIFILLFFFIITVTPEVEKRLVDATIPTEERLREFDPEHKLVFFIGEPLNSTLGTQPVIQFFDKVVSLENIPKAISEYRQTKLDASHRNSSLVATLETDYQVPYGIIADLNLQLQKAGIQKVNHTIEVKK